MSRPVAIDDAVILDAARAVFLAKGYRASTAEVARRARVSEGTLFKRYRTKSELFLAAMEIADGEQPWRERLLALAGRADPRRTLLAYGRDLLAQLRLVTPRILMVSASGLSFAKGYRPPEPPPPVAHIRALAGYFEAERRSGRWMMPAPPIIAHMFVGALAHYAFCETVFGYRSAPPEAFVRGLVDVICRARRATPRAGRRVGARSNHP